MDDWSEWVQSVGKVAVDAYAAKAQADNAYNIQRLQMQPATATPAAMALSPTMLLLGLGLVALLVLKD